MRRDEGDAGRRRFQLGWFLLHHLVPAGAPHRARRQPGRPQPLDRRKIAGLIHHSRLWREKNGQIVRVATVATRGAGAVPGASAVPPKDEKIYTERSADVTQTHGDRGANAPPRPPPADEEKVSGPWTLDCDEDENMAQLLTPLGRGEGPRLSKRRTAMDRSAGTVPSGQDGSSHFDRHAESAQSRRARRAAELARAPAADGDGRQPASVDDVKQTQSAAIRRSQTQSDANGNQTQSDDDERRRNERSSLKHAADAYAAGAISADEVCIVELLKLRMMMMTTTSSSATVSLIVTCGDE